MTRSSDVKLPLRILDAHNAVVQEAASKKTADRFSRNVFAALREGFYGRTDARARANPDRLHHVYEWGQVGSGSSRLFKLIATGVGTDTMVITYDYLKSTVPTPSGHVFSEKARVMEEGIEVTINPTNAETLAFEVDGEMVYTRGPVVVPNPGGDAVRNALRTEFMYYFRPSVLAKNPAYQQIVQEEKDRVLRQLGRAKA
jgi:hypothetical protein